VLWGSSPGPVAVGGDSDRQHQPAGRLTVLGFATDWVTSLAIAAGGGWASPCCVPAGLPLDRSRTYC